MAAGAGYTWSLYYLYYREGDRALRVGESGGLGVEVVVVVVVVVVGGVACRMWGLQGCCNECTAVKKNSVSLPGRERNKGGGGKRETWEEML